VTINTLDLLLRLILERTGLLVPFGDLLNICAAQADEHISFYILEFCGTHQVVEELLC
jgi:hypothetical protein